MEEVTGMGSSPSASDTSKQEGVISPSVESAILLAQDRPLRGVERVIEALQESAVLALGHKKGGMVAAQLLHFTSDDEGGHERIFLPIFTREQLVNEALSRNPGWREFQVLKVQGTEILTKRDDDVILLIDPWSSLAYQLPEPGTRALASNGQKLAV